MSAAAPGGRPQPVPLPGRSVKRMVVRFVLTALAGLVVLAAITAFVSRRVGTKQVVADARRVALVTGQGVVEPAVTPPLLHRNPDVYAAFDRLVHEHVLPGTAVRLRLLDPVSGRVIYSDDGQGVGLRTTLSDAMRRVMRTDAAFTMVSNTPQGQELEVFSRVQPRRTPPLLFQMGYRYSEVTRAGRNLWLDFAPMVLGALLLLQLLQFPLAWDLARRLRRSHEERERLLRSAIDASNSERRRIASDLHDGTVQDLAGVSLELSAASRRMSRTQAAGGVVVAERPDGEVLEAAARRVRSAVRSLRTLLVEIYPPNLEETGLEQALTDLAARLTERGITPHLDITLPDRPLPADTVTLLYRCGQELMRNASRHSGATNVHVRVAPDEAGMVVMEVTDDGRGFAPEAALSAPGSGHVGLRVMADLVGEAGGVVELASAPGKGTHLLVRVPA